MTFQVKPLSEFLVQPALPAPLSRMLELAQNVLWSWDPTIRLLFRRLDPALWSATMHNPIAMLGRVPQDTLERLAAEPRYLSLYRRACERFDAYMKRPVPPTGNQLIAYFSMEYGIVDCLPSYSGGLGMLAGDYLKACSDMQVPLVAVGLLYQKGYLQQYLNPDGWQHERYPLNDFYSLPVLPVKKSDGQDLLVSVVFPSGKTFVKVWEMRVGRIRLFLLDTNIPENENPINRGTTDQLYGGDSETRIRQEFVLGIGGLRVLKELNLEPTVFHMNEGHSAFLAMERIRWLIQQEGLSFEEALEATRYNNVFTTHTSVPAGIDVFDTSLVWQYFAKYAADVAIDFTKLASLASWVPGRSQDKFLMPILAINTSAYKNGVSRLHQEVSQKMWSPLWPELPTWEVPIIGITNGVHLPTWLNGDLAALYDQYLQPDWRERFHEPETWALVEDIPDQELMEAHRRRKLNLINFARERNRACALQRKASASEVQRCGEVLDPRAFTIGFARRFATYKRATLMFSDVARLKNILCHPERPVQIVFAGKAHPKDNPGKEFIRTIFQLTRDPELASHIVFLEDYGIQVARHLVQGVDLWLNNPRREEEACGTSGMKAGINGVLNLSVLDGWFDEAFEVSGGWAIGDREPYSEDQDEVHARSIYSLLENEIVPMFYDRADREIPREWMKRVKQSIMNLSARFDCQRMVNEYIEQLYEPAQMGYEMMQENHFALAKEKTRWARGVEQVWGQVKFLFVSPPPQGPVLSGSHVSLRVGVDLAGLTHKDVKVELVLGRVGVTGELEQTEVQQLPPIEENGSVVVFGKSIEPRFTGRLGYAVRISPNHYTDPITRPNSPLLKWALAGLPAEFST